MFPPFLSFDLLETKLIRYDLYDGDPPCVGCCEIHTLEYVDANRMSILKTKGTAFRLSLAQEEVAVLLPRVVIIFVECAGCVPNELKKPLDVFIIQDQKIYVNFLEY